MAMAPISSTAVPKRALVLAMVLEAVAQAAEILSGPMLWVLMLGPLAFVLIISLFIHRMSYLFATLMFIAFSVIMGLSVSTIFITYDLGSIFQVFPIAGGTFAVMAFIGATTKLDLTKIGNILYMALIGIILASIVNIFMGSSALSFGISILGVQSEKVTFVAGTEYQSTAGCHHAGPGWCL